MPAPPPPWCAAALALLVLWWAAGRRAPAGARRRMHLVADAHGNEALVLAAHVAGRAALVLVDTAYAGAPVISTSFLAVQGECARGAVPARYARALALLRGAAARPRRRQAAVQRLVAGGRCRAYTAGCTMRLMGIGATHEARADLLLCPAIALDGAAAPSHLDAAGDVMVTHPLPGSPHILTVDYLLHRAPCVLRPAAGEMLVGLPPWHAAPLAAAFEFFPARLAGGAFVVPMEVGGAALRVVVDTGANAPLSLAAGAVAKLRTCAEPAAPVRATQTGVNGERVCSDVLLARVRLGRLDLGEVHVFANDGAVAGADGYAGMGLLRALDVWLEPTRIGFRRSGLPPRAPTALRAGRCAEGARRPACAAGG
jgi:hypothetical protein